MQQTKKKWTKTNSGTQKKPFFFLFLCTTTNNKNGILKNKIFKNNLNIPLIVINLKKGKIIHHTKHAIHIAYTKWIGTMFETYRISIYSHMSFISQSGICVSIWYILLASSFVKFFPHFYKMDKPTITFNEFSISTSNLLSGISFSVKFLHIMIMTDQSLNVLVW